MRSARMLPVRLDRDTEPENIEQLRALSRALIAQHSGEEKPLPAMERSATAAHIIDLGIALILGFGIGCLFMVGGIVR